MDDAIWIFSKVLWSRSVYYPIFTYEVMQLEAGLLNAEKEKWLFLFILLSSLVRLAHRVDSLKTDRWAESVHIHFM